MEIEEKRMQPFLLPHLLSEAADKYPRKEAILFNERSISYEGLERASNRLAGTLIQQGTIVGDRVGILLTKSIESVISIFGVLKAGGVYVPIDIRNPAHRVEYMIRNCHIRVLITSSQHLNIVFLDPRIELPLKKVLLVDGIKEELPGQPNDVEFISWQTALEEIAEKSPVMPTSDTNPAYVLYTSGSTGNPKGVVISHINSLTFVNMAAEFFAIHTSDRMGNLAPFHFDLSVFDLFAGIKKGSSIVLIPDYLFAFPARLVEYIKEKDISVWNSVSSVLSMIADRGHAEKWHFPAIRLVHFSGDILPIKYLRTLKQMMPNARFFNIYGQTEANSSLCYPIDKIPDEDNWKIPIGKPFPNFQVFALNEANQEIHSYGEEGELYVRASTVALGYWGDREKSSHSFIQNPLHDAYADRVYRTGDIVKLGPDGNYVFIGRKDHLVKSRGYRIEINEIEVALSNCPGVHQAVVIPVQDDLVGNRLVAYVVPMGGIQMEEKDVLTHCSRLLPKYMIPEKIQFRKHLPQTSTGKIDRQWIIRELLNLEGIQ
jgi:amino acid adenylation domain-containing protein